MTITAKYRSICTQCGAQIQPGETIEWSKGAGARHTTCPAETPLPDDVETWTLVSGSGYGGRPYRVGEVRPGNQRAGQPAYVTVLQARQHYYEEDGMSFGVGSERGYTYSAVVRAATDEESAPLRARLAQAAARQAARAELDTIVREIETTGESPTESPTWPTGEQITIDDRHAIYGSGQYLVLTEDAVWAIRRNGADGDNWARNNLSGAIGHRVARTDALVTRIRTAVAAIRGEN